MTARPWRMHFTAAGLGLLALALTTALPAIAQECAHLPSRDFGDAVIGTHVLSSFRIDNDGTEPIELLPQFVEPSDQFFMPLQQVVLQPGEYHRFEISFHPTVRGYHEATIDLGNDLCADLLVTGTVLARSCLYTPSPLDLGSLAVGASTTTFLTVTNDGDLPVDLTPTTLTEGAAVSSNLIHLEVGETGQVEVQFSPHRPLAFSGVIDWGGVFWPSECAAVPFGGSAYVNMDPGQDRLGMFFDPGFQDLMPNTTVPNEVVTGYLVLTDPSAAAGVAAWECAPAVAGGGVLLDWTLQGEAIDAGTGGELVVGIGGDPLPSGPTVLLATCRILVPDPTSEVTVALGPVSTPTIPGLMAWIPGDGSGEPRVLRPFTGVAEVAWFNIDQPGDPSPVPEVPAADPAARLLANAPNPFNPATEIRYQTVRTGRVRIAVFDLQGRLVRNLLDEVRPAGSQAVSWNGRDRSGRTVASGAYYVRLEAGPDSDLRKVLLLK